MTFDEYKERTHEIINEISDICSTAIITDRMTKEEVIEFYERRIQRIDEIARYPETFPREQHHST